jgi:transcriptional regulator with XRE-family HTH domain
MLAERAGLSVEVIRKLEQNARRSARVSTLSALARALDVPVGVLLGGAPADEHAGAPARPVHRVREAEQSRPTLLRALIVQRHWQRFQTFEAQFRHAARELAKKEHDPDLAKLTVSSRQWERWYAGNVKTEPHPDACRVLEHMFGYPAEQLVATHEASAIQPAQQFDSNQEYGSVQPRPDSSARAPGIANLIPYLEELYLLSQESPDSAMARERAYDQLVKVLSGWANTMKRRELLQVLGWAASAAGMKWLHGEFNADEVRIAHAFEPPTVSTLRLLNTSKTCCGVLYGKMMHWVLRLHWIR